MCVTTVRCTKVDDVTFALVQKLARSLLKSKLAALLATTRYVSVPPSITGSNNTSLKLDLVQVFDLILQIYPRNVHN